MEDVASWLDYFYSDHSTTGTGLDRITDTPIPLDTGDFRLMSRRALDAFLSLPEQARFIRGMVAWIGFRQVPFPYKRDERFAGVTKYPLSKMIRFALDALTGFSSAPLKLASSPANIAAAVLAALADELARIAVIDQRIDVAVGNNVDAATSATVTTIGTTFFNKFFTVKMRRSLPSLSG